MVLAQFFLTPEGGLTGFSVEGHSGYSEIGSDIVCAAVSSAAYMAANTVTEVLGVTPAAVRIGEAGMLFRIENRDAPLCRDILTGLKLHLLALEEQYENYIKVKYLEV